MEIRRVAILALAAASAAGAPLVADDTGTGQTPAAEPNADEQFGIWKLNKARHDPPAYGAEIGLDLTGVAPQPPLAVNPNLMASTRFHAKEMLDNDYFAHISAVTGKSPQQMAADAGYAGWDHVAESLDNGSMTFADAIAALVIDADPSQHLGHRIQLLAIEPWAQMHREIGAGEAIGQRPDGLTHRLYAVQTGYVSAGDTFLTGVVFFDHNANGRFDFDEGLPDATIDAGGAYVTHSMKAGGWAMKVPAGIYTVRCSGGTFQGVATARVGVTGGNHEIDFSSGRGAGDIDFSGPGGIRVAVTALPIGGMAPLDVALRATSSGPSTSFSWSFGDGETGAGSDVNHAFAPGVWVVRVLGSDVGGVGGALTAVCADGPLGSGDATIAPASRALKPTAFGATVDRTLPGHDSVTLTATIEMPAGWTRGRAVASAVIAGVKADFPLVPGKDAFKETGRRSFKLTYKHPRHGAPLPAGVKAKVTMTVKGDFAALLDDLGIHDRTEKRRIYGVPFLLSLGETCWGTTATIVVTSVEDVASKASLDKQ